MNPESSFLAMQLPQSGVPTRQPTLWRPSRRRHVWWRTIAWGLLCSIWAACTPEPASSTSTDAGHTEYREPVYDWLPEDDPNQTCCYVQVLYHDSDRSTPGGRRPCNVDPDDGPRIRALDGDLYVLRMIDGCPVFVLPDPDATP